MNPLAPAITTLLAERLSIHLDESQVDDSSEHWTYSSGGFVPSPPWDLP